MKSEWHPLTGTVVEEEEAVVNNDDVTTEHIFKILSGELLPEDIKKARALAERKTKIEEDRIRVRRDLPKYLDELTTKDLLDGLANLRCNGYIEVFGDFTYHQFYDYADFSTTDAVKSVLATREHIPNKPQAKAIRRAKARVGHGSKKKKLKFSR